MKTMKKTLLLLAVLLGFAAGASAQSKALGARFGAGPLEISYQHWFGDPNFAEVTGGLYFINGSAFQVTGTYNWMLCEPDWTDRGNWGVYGGPGVTLGSVSVPVDGNRSGYVTTAMFGIVGQLGIEYTFWFPLQLSVDVRPVILGYANSFYSNPLGLIPTFSARYAF